MINKEYKIIIISTIITIIFLFLSYTTHKNGKDFYIKKIKIYDFCHKYLPDLSNNKITLHVTDIVSLIPYIIVFIYGNTHIYFKLISYLIPIFLFRSITINSTILPKNIKCDDKKYDIYNVIFGHCYDKIFSGHISSNVLISYILYDNIIKNKIILVVYNLFLSILLLVTRGHYTIDVILGIYIASCNYLLGYDLQYFIKYFMK